jgi:hypothetical protein
MADDPMKNVLCLATVEKGHAIFVCPFKQINSRLFGLYAFCDNWCNALFGND